MAPIQPPQPERDFGGYAGFEGESGGSDGFPRSRKMVRYGVPVAIAGVAAATIGLGTALASTGGGPSLPKITAEQLLDKIATSKVQTVSGSVQFTTNLGLPDGLLGGAGGASAGPFGGHGGHPGGKGGSSADPQTRLTELLAGTHTLRVAADGPDHQRLSIVDNTSEYTVVHNGDQMWAYDSSSNSVYHQTGRQGAKGEHRRTHGENAPATPQDAVRQALKNVDPTTSVTVDGTAEVAGQHAYQLLIKPKQSDTTVDSIRVAVDADNGVPLRFTLTPKGGGAPAVDIGYTKVDFGKPAAGTFDFSVPKGAKVTEGKADGAGRTTRDHGGLSGLNVIGRGWDAVAELKSAGGQLPQGKGDKSGAGAQGLLGSFGHRVKGGTLVSTRLVNVLITDKGAVYAGAVSQDALVKAADAAAK